MIVSPARQPPHSLPPPRRMISESGWNGRGMAGDVHGPFSYPSEIACGVVRDFFWNLSVSACGTRCFWASFKRMALRRSVQFG